MLDMHKIIVSHSIVYVISGTVKIVTPEYKEFIISEGEMLFMPRNSYMISDFVQEDQAMEVYLFFFDHTIAEKFFHCYETSHNPKNVEPLQLQVTNNIFTYLSTLKRVHYKNIADTALLELKLLEFLALIHEENPLFIDILKSSELINRDTDIKSYMTKHYDKNLTVTEWASLMGKSLSTFNRHFKQKYHESPKQWILQRNMQLAFAMLQEGHSISEIAQEFNYANLSNFIKAYKSVHKLTPKQHQLRTSG